ncbi:MAG: shikimate kinase [Cyanobacteria bacterium J06598_4]
MSDLLQGLNIYLVGMMGAGKSTVGRYLAANLNYRFIDTDRMIEAISKQSIADIFAQSGEAGFRKLETQVLAELSVYTRSVIATGGGIVQSTTNWSYLRQGLVIWLDVDTEILRQRVSQNTNRPLAGKLESLLETRRPLYAQGDLRVYPKPEQSPQAVAVQIEELIPSVLKPQA